MVFLYSHGHANAKIELESFMERNQESEESISKKCYWAWEEKVDCVVVHAEMQWQNNTNTIQVKKEWYHPQVVSKQPRTSPKLPFQSQGRGKWVGWVLKLESV